MPAPRGFVQWVDQLWHREAILPRGGRLLVAVSGGADSIALLRLMIEINRSKFWRWELVVGHVDHGIRNNSDADARFVWDLAKKSGHQFVSRRLRLGRQASEEDARDARMKALATMVSKHKCRAVVMAHHLDDRAETVLMKLFRGCGLDGLIGIRRISAMQGMTIYRPLLSIQRETLRDYLRNLGQPWREDATNIQPLYTRNRLRADVLPRIERIWPGAVEAIGRLSEVAGDAQSLVRDLQRLLSRTAGEEISPRRSVYAKEYLKTWPIVLAELLRQDVERLGGTREIADFERIGEAIGIVLRGRGGKQVELGRGIILTVKGKQVIIERRRRRRPS